MSDVLMQCPTTQLTIRTGLDMDPESFRLSVLVGTSLKCPQCGARHAVVKSQCWLQREGEVL